MPRPANMVKLKKTIDRLSFAEKQQVAEWVKVNPEIEKLNQQKAEIEKRIAELTGGTAPVAKRPGRKPGTVVSKPTKPVKAKGKPGRPPKAKPDSIEGDAAPKRRGRPVGSGKVAKAEKAPKAAKQRKQREWTPEQKAAAAERLAKGKAAAKAKVKRVIMDNDLIKSPTK